MTLKYHIITDHYLNKLFRLTSLSLLFLAISNFILIVETMPLFQKLKNVFTKKEFDYDSPDLDLYKFHPQIRIFLVFNGIFFNNAESNLRLICFFIFRFFASTAKYISDWLILTFRFCWPVLSTMLTFVGASMELMFIYHGIDTEDYSFATECFCYFLILSTVPLVYTSALSGRIEIINLLNSMNQDFLYICKLECKYRYLLILKSLKWNLPFLLFE